MKLDFSSDIGMLGNISRQATAGPTQVVDKVATNVRKDVGQIRKDVRQDQRRARKSSRSSRATWEDVYRVLMTASRRTSRKGDTRSADRLAKAAGSVRRYVKRTGQKLSSKVGDSSRALARALAKVWEASPTNKAIRGAARSMGAAGDSAVKVFQRAGAVIKNTAAAASSAAPFVALGVGAVATVAVLGYALSR